jgi:predicted nucleic acid-binding protein
LLKQTVDFRPAADMLGSASTALRAGDALHLAIVRRLNGAVTTLDRTVAEAAKTFGITAIVP